MLELHKNFEKSQILTDRVRAVAKKCVTKTPPISRSRGYPVQNSRAWGACKSGSPRRTDRPALKWCALKIEIRTPRPDSKFGRGKASYNAEQGLCHDRKKKQEFAREQKKKLLENLVLAEVWLSLNAIFIAFLEGDLQIAVRNFRNRNLDFLPIAYREISGERQGL